MGIGSRIDALISARGTRPGTLAREAGVSKNTVYSIIKRDNDKVDPDILARLAKALAVPLSALYGEDTPLPAHPDILPVQVCRIPMLGSIACGEPIYASEERESYCMADDGLDADFCLRASGESMTGARIYDGDVVFIRMQSSVDNGEIAAVIINDEATLKRVYFYPDEEKLILTPENPRYAPIVYLGVELEGIKILGKAVAFQSAVI